MFLVGLTGGIATGKSTVSAMLKDLNVPFIDADVIAREVVKPGRKAWRLIREKFGEEVLLPTLDIDRDKLAEIIFSNPEKRKLLNSITHPEIYKEIFRQCFWLFMKGTQFVVLDLPLLFESGYMTKFLHKIIVVNCTPQEQLKRLMARNGYSESNARQRIEAQMSMAQKCRFANYVIDNSKASSLTRKQVENVVRELRSSYAHWPIRFFIYGGALALLAGAIHCTKRTLSLTWK